MSSRRITKDTLAKRVHDLIAGTQKHSANGQLTFGGETFTAEALIQEFENLVNALSTADAAKASWQDALKRQADVKAKVAPIIKGYQSFLVALHGNAPATLAEYGLTPRKVRAPIAADKKALAAAKRKATRALRHTLGPKQKKDIKATAPSTPSTVATPAAPTPKAGS